MIDKEGQHHGVVCDTCGLFLPVTEAPQTTLGELYGTAMAQGWQHIPGSVGKRRRPRDTCPECVREQGERR
jgi:hypothetical protein